MHLGEEQDVPHTGWPVESWCWVWTSLAGSWFWFWVLVGGSGAVWLWTVWLWRAGCWILGGSEPLEVKEKMQQKPRTIRGVFRHSWRFWYLERAVWIWSLQWVLSLRPASSPPFPQSPHGGASTQASSLRPSPASNALWSRGTPALCSSGRSAPENTAQLKTGSDQNRSGLFLFGPTYSCHPQSFQLLSDAPLQLGAHVSLDAGAHFRRRFGFLLRCRLGLSVRRPSLRDAGVWRKMRKTNDLDEGTDTDGMEEKPRARFHGQTANRQAELCSSVTTERSFRTPEIKIKKWETPSIRTTISDAVRINPLTTEL